MKASEALATAREYHKEQKEGWEKYLEDIYEQVERAAKKGWWELPLRWNLKVKPNSDQMAAILERLEGDGYYIYKNESYVEPLRISWEGGE